jgi:hypothetical protein
MRQKSAVANWNNPSFLVNLLEWPITTLSQNFTMRLWTTEKGRPSVQTVAEIAKVLGVPMEDLVNKLCRYHK